MKLKTFCIDYQKIKYWEQYPDNPLFEKHYLIENPMLESIVAIPDGCMDVQFTWENDRCRGYICGSFLTGKISQTGTYRRCFGMKIRSGVLFDFMRANISDMIESRIPLSRFLDVRELETSLQKKTEFSEMIWEAEHYFDSLHIIPIHNLASDTAEMICDNQGARRVDDMIQDLGYSHRYVDDVFKRSFGLSVKKYSDIMRIQRAIDDLDSKEVMDVIAELGYYDQAHFIHEFKKYTSMTPRSFVKHRRLSPSEQSLVIV